MLTIGLTGGTGSGKTTALNVLKESGATAIDCDALYHKLLESDAQLLSAIENKFGCVYNGALDRQELGRMVFRDNAKLLELTAITDGFVKAEVLNILDDARKRGTALVAVDAIRLIESGLSDICNATVFVTADKNVRLCRIIARDGISAEYAGARIASQKPDIFFIERCDYTLVNNGKRESFVAAFKELIRNIENTGGKKSDV